MNIPNQINNEPNEEPVNLPLENELLKMKMQAERGAVFGEFQEMPAAIENEFLKNVQKFEEMWEDCKKVAVYEFIGCPNYRKSIDVSDKDLQLELLRLIDILNENGITIDAFENLDKRTQYDFITEEFFRHEIDEVRIPGMLNCFDYREFHPDHKDDIERTANEFISQWFSRSAPGYRWDLGKQMILPDGRILSQHELNERLQKVFASYIAFTDDTYTFNDISFQLNGVHDLEGLGHAEGLVRYNAESEAGEIINIEGPFKIYMSFDGYSWDVFYFVWPGFVW